MSIELDARLMPIQGWQISPKAEETVVSSPRLSKEPQTEPPRSPASDAGRSHLEGDDDGSCQEEVKSLNEQLFDNAAALKKRMSNVAMHLPVPLRDALRLQIDRLLSADAWEEGESQQISEPSFSAFLKFLVHALPVNVPGLGVGPSGHVLASWHKGETRIYMEFLTLDRAKVSIAKLTDRADRELLGWQGNVASLRRFLERNEVLMCLN